MIAASTICDFDKYSLSRMKGITYNDLPASLIIVTFLPTVTMLAWESMSVRNNKDVSP